MVCEELFNLFGTSSDEVTENAKNEAMKEADAYYQPKIDELSLANNELSSINDALTAENEHQSSIINYLQNLLTQHNIPFRFEA
ncbi:MAG: hypothetical protein NC433_07685 [Clostridiales bacterium]|nr:hypothetical protein [Clostridiales bacterium]